MSQLPSCHVIHADNRLEERIEIGPEYPPQTLQYQKWQGHVRFSDSSGPLYAMYLKVAEEQDQRRAERLRADTDQILLFCGLFSAAVAALVVPSMPNLKSTPDPTTTATEQMSSNIETMINILSNYTSFPFPDYCPYSVGTKFAVLVNSFWLLSLLLSITCALIAISLQQWAHRHAKVTPMRFSLPEQARMRAFFAKGIETQNYGLFVESLPVLVHVSLLFFFAGFALFVYDLNNTVFALSCCWTVFFILGYGYITIMPIFRPDSPFYTPLSTPAARIYAGVFRGTSRVLWMGHSCIGDATRVRLQNMKDRHRHWLSWDMMKFAEEKARKQTPEINGDVLKRTLDAMTEDHELEQFFESFPGFCDSKIVEDAQRSLDVLGRDRLADELGEFWNRTLLSNQVPVSVKERRLIVCMRVLEAADLHNAAPRIFRDLSHQRMGRILQAIELAHSLKPFRNGKLAPLAVCIISCIISNVQERDDRWFSLVMDQLDMTEDVLRSYLAHGDSVLLANLIHVTRHLFRSILKGDLDLTRRSLRCLPAVARFDILNTVPELQREFCALWNEIVDQAQKNKGGSNIFTEILVEIWRLHLALHRTDSAPTDVSHSATGHNDKPHQPASHTLCEIADDRSESTSHQRDVVGDASNVANHVPTTTSLPDVNDAVSSHAARGVTQDVVDTSPTSAKA
ncbi:hypothetical protein F5148DRAFT_636534 [Russula earlei]|uniref:Uncharacterized protein n=1 Tax=Russula earlei TaxID=71964 RepID=A0ACC0UGV3_9AGAM|nr:hypothetical protein F5148DRAFT_636534 [Russula earlei]